MRCIFSKFQFMFVMHLEMLCTFSNANPTDKTQDQDPLTKVFFTSNGLLQLFCKHSQMHVYKLKGLFCFRTIMSRSIKMDFPWMLGI